LTAVLNATFARLESSFDQLRRFTADASHELRPPLAVVFGIGETALAERRSPGEYNEAIGSMLEELDRMPHLVDTLLPLSSGDAGTIRLSRETMELGQLACEVVLSLAILVEERSQTVTLDIADQLRVSVDPLVLREAVTNVSITRSSTAPTDPRSVCVWLASAIGPCCRSGTTALAFRRGIASESFTVSSASMRRDRGTRGSGWRLPNGPSKCMTERSTCFNA
jgi:light-regulated signal transduction histidine kinase (bacteriophytochrome)